MNKRKPAAPGLQGLWHRSEKPEQKVILKFKTMTRRFLSLFLLAATATAYAQNTAITGRVTDANNEPLIGVSVTIKGTSTGAVTDF